MNSAHQLWSKWEIEIIPGLPFSPDFEQVKTNIARFIRKGFGTSGQCRIRQHPGRWTIEFLVDSPRHPDDAEIFKYFARSLTDFFRNGFGPQTEVNVSAKLMSGERLDGKPADQMLILPRLNNG